MKTTSREQYDEMVKQASPNSHTSKDSAYAFVIGGLVCTLSQMLCNFYVSIGNTLPQARMAVTMSLIFAAAALTVTGVYDRLAKHAGAGLVVPITGFANSVISCGMEFKSEGMVLGVGAKIFTVAGPVIVYGLGASVLYGIVLYIIQLF